MAIVYRLESNTRKLNDQVNIGVYRGLCIGSYCDGFHSAAYGQRSNYDSTHPTPSEDPKLARHTILEDHVFVFTSAEDLHRWFSEIANTNKHYTDQLHIGVYFVPDEHYIKGTFQAVANCEFMERVDAWEPTRRG